LPRNPRSQHYGCRSCATGIGAALLAVGVHAALAVEPPPVEFTSVPASAVQAGGPGYDFRMARFEIRNDEFAAFLNDAIANPLSPTR
jgi:hypothetical protein